MFVDEKILRVRAGKGGDGAVLFRREKYVPRGGPDGGDGGNGGNVMIVGRANLHALAHLAHLDRIEAEDGRTGGHSRSTGKGGASAYCHVPLGTEVYVLQGEEWVKLGEILEEGQELLVAKGGSGGWGNWHFRSSVQQVPKHANPGHPGEEKQLRLVLKLIADVGLIGLPNAGKSTLLSVISAAKPKIADYPFTTLEPQLGVVKAGKGADTRSFVVADLPGLIEGASKGKGLGVQFLKHVERTRKLLHCLAGDAPLEELIANYQTIRQELSEWSVTLANKKEVLVLTKTDLLPPQEAAEKVKGLEKALGKKVIPLSAAAHTGLEELLTELA